MRNHHVLLDIEDERLTAPERHYLRQIALRLQGGSTAQPAIDKSARARHEPGSLEEELDRVFGEAKPRVSDN